MIRRYRSADLEAVLNVWESASRLAHPFLDDEFLASEREQIRTVHMAVAETWVREAHGEVLGFMALIGSEVGAIFVHPDRQRSGTGRALMAHAQALRGTLELDVFEENAIGRAFYARCGFEFVETRTHPPTGERLLRLRLPADRALSAALPDGA